MPRLTKWLNGLVKSGALAALLTGPLLLPAQERQRLTLQEAFDLAEKQYPLTGQKALVRQTESLTLQNLNTGYLPQVTINGQASYQSDVTRISVPLPGFKIPEQPKDQYRAVADVSQLLYDGGIIRSQKEIQRRTTEVEEDRVGVELHGLKARVNQLYFSILYHDELLKQTALAARDVQIGIEKVRPQVENRVVLRSNLQLLQAQLLQMEQRTIEIKAARKGLIDALALFLKQPLDEGVQLEAPASVTAADTVITRPEVRLLESQSRLLAGQERLIGARNSPKASAFVQGGYGRPGLNMLSNEFKSFYIGGVRFTWPLGGLYNTRRDRQLIYINRQSVDLQKETFLLNTRAQLQQQKADIDRYEALVTSDGQIIELRRQITEAAKAQLDNAVITANDYLLQVNAEDAARQALILHRLQLLQAQTNYAITSGKL
jgi:outer membrane protein TolC